MDLMLLRQWINYAIGKEHYWKTSDKLTKAQKHYQKKNFDAAVLNTLAQTAQSLETYLGWMEAMIDDQSRLSA